MNWAITDFRTSEEELLALEDLGFDVILSQNCTSLYDAVCGHPDMQLCVIGKRRIIVHRDADKSFIEKLKSYNIDILYSAYNLNENYPQDIILNSVILGDIFVHRIDYTDPVLLNSIKCKKIINVRQGYTKCSTAVLNNHAVITSDPGIAAALSQAKIDVLHLPYGDIELPGLNYGFIGGTCGLIDETHLAFFGELKHYRFGNQVLQFLRKHHMKPVYLRKGKLIDRGTLITAHATR